MIPLRLVELGAHQALGQLGLELRVGRPGQHHAVALSSVGQQITPSGSPSVALAGLWWEPGPGQGTRSCGSSPSHSWCFKAAKTLGAKGWQLTPGDPQDKVQLLRLWYHENCRVFRDRLVNEEDRSWFDKLLKGCMEKWDVTFDKVCPFQPILYGDFMAPGSDVKSYELITSEQKVRESG